MKKLPPTTLRKHKGISFVGVSTCFFVYNRKSQFFMAKRSKNSRDEKGRWEVGGGGLKMGQTAEDNMRREVKEEYNARPLKVSFLGYRDILRGAGEQKSHWLALDFAVLVDGKEIKINEPDMFDDCGWFTLGNLPSPAHSQQATFFKKYASELKSLLDQAA